MNARQVRLSEVSGTFGLPIGISALNRSWEDGWAKKVTVSTVCLEGAHAEDPLHICEPEHGYETMVFLEGIESFAVFTAHYRTRQEAVRGHASALRKLLTHNLPLAIPLTHYSAYEVVGDEENAG